MLTCKYVQESKNNNTTAELIFDMNKMIVMYTIKSHTVRH